MKKAFSASLVALTLFFGSGVDIHVAEARGSAVHVKGYYRNGTYVAPHYRSAPDGSVGNNWSTIGNVNPYTGKVGTKNPLNTSTYTTPSYKHQPSQPIPRSRFFCLLVLHPPRRTLQRLVSRRMQTHPILVTGLAREAIQKISLKIPAIRSSFLKMAHSIIGSGWICNRGYAKLYKRGTCDAVIIPAHARLDYFGIDFSCDRGFFKNLYNGTCDTVVVPINAHLDYFGSNWECDRGYSKNIYKATCEKAFVPLHADSIILAMDGNVKVDTIGHISAIPANLYNNKVY